METYYYVRFRWFKGVNIKKLSEDFERLFTIEKTFQPSNEFEITLARKKESA